MNWKEVYSQQRAEDVYLYHSYLYYVCHRPVLTDVQFDAMQKFFQSLYPDSEILRDFVGSDNPNSYPLYVTEYRRPQSSERRI